MSPNSYVQRWLFIAMNLSRLDSDHSGHAPLAPVNNSPQNPQVIAPWLRGLKAYAPDNNQAIRCPISAYPCIFDNPRNRWVGSWNIYQPSW